MLRIRKNKIKLVVEHDFGDNLSGGIEHVKNLVSNGLDTLRTVAPRFDEVRIDNDGNVHSKTLAAPADEEE